MVPLKNKKKFVQEYGNLWYLREFDHLPEPLELYDKDINDTVLELIKDGKFDGWAIFNSLGDAKSASAAVRRLLGISCINALQPNRPL